MKKIITLAAAGIFLLSLQTARAQKEVPPPTVPPLLGDQKPLATPETKEPAAPQEGQAGQAKPKGKAKTASKTRKKTTSKRTRKKTTASKKGASTKGHRAAKTKGPKAAPETKLPATEPAAPAAPLRPWPPRRPRRPPASTADPRKPSSCNPDERKKPMKFRVTTLLASLALCFALVTLSSATEQGFLLNGTHWEAFGYNLKVAYIKGVGNMADFEAKTGAGGQAGCISTALVDELKNKAVLQVVQEVDKYYKEHPGEKNCPVLEVILRASTKLCSQETSATPPKK